MRAKDALRMFGGAVVIYVVMAACGSEEPGTLRRVDNGSGGASPTGGAEGAGGADAGSSVADAIAAVIDAVANPVPEAKAQSASGSRLRAKYLTGADGSKQFLGWYDSARKEDCSFQLASDGKTRCMPTTGAFATSYFSDAGCTKPLAIVIKTACSSASPPKYAGLLGQSGCVAGYVPHAIDSAFNAPDIYTGSPAACSKSMTALVAASYDLYTVGAELVPGDFVAGSISTE